MSRIKDLYAIENGIDDLMPVDNPVEKAEESAKKFDGYFEAIKASIIKDLAEIKEEILDEGKYSSGVDDEGNTEFYFENFYGLCHSQSEYYTEKYIEAQHLDITDMEYELLCLWVGDWLANYLADFEAICLDVVREDAKYKLDEIKEKNGEC